ncbi:hypothetical protein OHU29_08595 [Streptomyces canus]
MDLQRVGTGDLDRPPTRSADGQLGRPDDSDQAADHLAVLLDGEGTDVLSLRGRAPVGAASGVHEAELDALVTQVRAWMDAGVGAGEIGVSARFKKSCVKTVAHLKAAGLPSIPLRAVGTAGEAEAVRVGTMHSFKGLEFRCVGVVGVNGDALPFLKPVTPADMDPQQHEANMMSERCLLFVACTRARDSLYVSWSGNPSPFLTEAGV